ncbi:MAG: FliG C-terminal domain-containing protein [Bdellovibrio sp.]|jgi:flagellar motor switch protein FliG
MSILSRFRQSGGFLKLILLVESSDAQKQKTLLHLVSQEDPGWAHLLKLKTLSSDRILTWPESVLCRIWASSPLQLAVAIWQKSPAVLREKIERSLPRTYQSSFRKALEETPPLDEAEFATAQLRLVLQVREMSISGQLDFQDFDPALLLQDQLNDHFEPFKKTA